MARKEPGARKSWQGSGRQEGALVPDDEPPPRKRRWAVWYTLAIAAVWAIFAIGLTLYHWVSDIPDSANLLAYEPGNDITLLDAKGRLIARRGLVQGASVGVGELPPYVGNAFIAV